MLLLMGQGEKWTAAWARAARKTCGSDDQSPSLLEIKAGTQQTPGYGEGETPEEGMKTGGLDSARNKKGGNEDLYKQERKPRAADLLERGPAQARNKSRLPSTKI